MIEEPTAPVAEDHTPTPVTDLTLLIDAARAYHAEHGGDELSRAIRRMERQQRSRS